MKYLYVARDKDGRMDDCGVFLAPPIGPTDEGFWIADVEENFVGVIPAAEAQQAFEVRIEPGEVVQVPFGDATVTAPATVI